MLETEVKEAIREACRKAGSQVALAKMAGMTQGRISDYIGGRCDVGNITLGSLKRIFPGMQIVFFPDGDKSGNSAIETQLLEIFRSLSSADQVKCLTVVAANFGEKIREETRG